MLTARYVLILVVASVSAGLAYANEAPYKQSITKTIQASYEGPQCLKRDARVGEPKSYCGLLPSLAAVNIREATLEVISKDLERPWSFEFIDENTLIIGEFAGTFKLFNLTTNQLTPVEGGPKLPELKGQIGMLDVALPPDFESTREIYFTHVVGHEGKHATAISKGVLNGNKLTNISKIYQAKPFMNTTGNFGGALMFGEDGLLYAAIGDSGKKSQVQKPESSLGKIVRIGRDGSVPADNPFVDDEKFLPEIFVLGDRNPQGLTRDPVTGDVYEAEHGPMGGDEVNRIVAGENYGWPKVSYGMGYTYKKLAAKTFSPEFPDPLFYYLPSRAISPLVVYRGEKFPEFDGDILVGALRGRSVSRLDLKDGRILSETKILWEVDGRVRDIKVASDGAIWLITYDGRLLRVDREKVTAIKGIDIATHRGKEIFDLVCATCHSEPFEGAPGIGEPAEWQDRLNKGYKELLQNTIAGVGAMPPRGLCEDCTEQELRQALDYIIRVTSEAQ